MTVVQQVDHVLPSSLEVAMQLAETAYLQAHTHAHVVHSLNA